MVPPSATDQFQELLPLASQWAAEEERRILREGVSLTESQIKDAKKLGVQQPERVRLLRVDSVPGPSHPALKTAQAALRFLSPATRGLTLRYGIFIRSDCWGDRSLVVHELVHTAQYERLGGILPFLRKYLSECFTLGYAKAPMELEAVASEKRICSA
jgi:hypothetical protein